MKLLKVWFKLTMFVSVTILVFAFPLALSAQEYKTFESEEYGFAMQYPASWVKIEKPKGNYYVIFQAPDLTDNFRNRIHVAAHKPVKDPLNVYLQEFRNGIADLQKQTTGTGAKEKQEVKLIDEGEFKSEIPGAYYFFIQAYESNLKIWMDIVIVYFKYEQTLLRISCLAPSSVMEKLQPLFNDVLVSVKFVSEGTSPTSQPGPAMGPAPTPGTGAPQSRPAPAPPAREKQPSLERREPGMQFQPAPLPQQPQQLQPPQQLQQPPQPAPGPRPVPRGPVGEPERPGTGIVN
jgi:hypothetical protein